MKINRPTKASLPNPVRRAIRRSSLLALVAVLSTARVVAGPIPETTAFLTPHPKIGDRYPTIFSKTDAIDGTGFAPVVGRISGTAVVTIRSASATEIAGQEDDLYDGSPPHRGAVAVRDRGATICFDGECRINDQTSAVFFNPFLWGPIPNRLSNGATWSTEIAAPWEIGPAGRQEVRVSRLDASGGLITLVRTGEGSGPSHDDGAVRSVAIVIGDKKVKATLVPGAARWTGTATIVRGVTVSDEITVDREVILATPDGGRLKAHERIYTVFSEAT